jgi:hypothetical protein
VRSKARELNVSLKLTNQSPYAGTRHNRESSRERAAPRGSFSIHARQGLNLPDWELRAQGCARGVFAIAHGVAPLAPSVRASADLLGAETTLDQRRSAKPARFQNSFHRCQVVFHSSLDGATRERWRECGGTLWLEFPVELDNRLATIGGETVAVLEGRRTRGRAYCELSWLLARDDLEVVDGATCRKIPFQRRETSQKLPWGCGQLPRAAGLSGSTSVVAQEEEVGGVVRSGCGGEECIWRVDE